MLPLGYLEYETACRCRDRANGV